MKTLISLLVLTITANFGYSQTTPPCNDVIPSFSYHVNPAAGGIQFTDESKLLSSEVSYTCSWDFGNDMVSNERNPFISCTEKKTFQVKLTVTDSNGCSKTVEKEITYSENK